MKINFKKFVKPEVFNLKNLMIILTSGLLILSFPPFRIYWLAWFAMIPFIFVLRRTEDPKERFFDFAGNRFFILYRYPSLVLSDFKYPGFLFPADTFLMLGPVWSFN